jgi:phosphoribosylformylglycinamidine (FGAM) synthase-like enzyme
MEAPSFASRDLNADLLAILASGDVCSKHWIWQQYDYTVRTNTLGSFSESVRHRIHHVIHADADSQR